jgi:hypothetical protein
MRAMRGGLTQRFSPFPDSGCVCFQRVMQAVNWLSFFTEERQLHKNKDRISVFSKKRLQLFKI